MKWPDSREMYNRVFPTDQSLITNTLFNLGYRRFQVTVRPAKGAVYEAVVWSRDGEAIPAFWQRRGAEVSVKPLPLAAFKGNVIGAGYGGFAGDIILNDDTIEEEHERYEAAARGDGGEPAPRDGDTNENVA